MSLYQIDRYSKANVVREASEGCKATPEGTSRERRSEHHELPSLQFAIECNRNYADWQAAISGRPDGQRCRDIAALTCGVRVGAARPAPEIDCPAVSDR